MPYMLDKFGCQVEIVELMTGVAHREGDSGDGNEYEVTAVARTIAGCVGRCKHHLCPYLFERALG